MKFIDNATIHAADEEALIFDVSDEALEAAAGSMTEKAGAFTMAFCSNVNSCPQIGVRKDRS